MSRSGVLALAAVVLGGLGALWYLVFRDDGRAAAHDDRVATAAPAPRRATGVGPSLPPAPTGPVLKSAGRPATPADTSAMEVRDHREPAAAAPLAGIPGTTDPPPPAPAGQLPPLVSRALYKQTTVPALRCGRLIQPADRGARPRIGAKMKLEVKAGALRVVEVEAVAEDVSGPDVDVAKQCMRDALMGQEMPAPDAQDSDAVAMSLSFVVR